MCKILVISFQLGNDRSDFIRKTLAAHNAGSITRSSIKFQDGFQKGLETFISQQKPDYITLDDTGRLSRKLINRIKQHSGNAKFIHVGYNELVGFSELHRQFENWSFKLEDLEPAAEAEETTTQPAALEAVA